MKEIGGYFEIGGFRKDVYHKNAIALNTATNAVIYLIKAKRIQKIYLPYYLCNCLDKIKEYCKVEYYKINKDFTPNLDFMPKENEYVYFVNYFGMFDNVSLAKYKDKYLNIIVDNVQAFFQMPLNETDTIYSCRKFFGVPDGAYLYTDASLNEEISMDNSTDRLNHLFGRLEENASKYFQKYRENEILLSNLNLEYMSKSTELIMNAMDYNDIKEARTKNFKFLNENLKDSNKLSFNDIEGAYMYPYYCDNAKNIKRKLLENKIYIPTLWPNVLEQKEDKIAYDYVTKILCLPCDQRYNESDMDRVISIIKGR